MSPIFGRFLVGRICATAAIAWGVFELRASEPGPTVQPALPRGARATADQKTEPRPTSGPASAVHQEQRALADDHIANRRYPEAVRCLEAVLASCRSRVAAGDSQDPVEMAEVLLDLGQLYGQLDRHADARRLLEEALGLLRRVFPEKDHPDGHPTIARTLSVLGAVMHAHEEYGESGEYCRQALEMNRRLYPKDKYPHGHPEIAASLRRMGFMVGGGRKGCALYEEAIQMQRHFADKHPRGYQELAITLNDLGNALAGLGEYERATEALKEALEVNRRLYPEEKYPAGHSQLATNLWYLGRLSWMRSDYLGAEAYPMAKSRGGRSRATSGRPGTRRRESEGGRSHAGDQPRHFLSASGATRPGSRRTRGRNRVTMPLIRPSAVSSTTCSVLHMSASPLWADTPDRRTPWSRGGCVRGSHDRHVGMLPSG